MDYRDRTTDPDNLSPTEKYDLLFYPGQAQVVPETRSWSYEDIQRPEAERGEPVVRPAIQVAGPATAWEQQLVRALGEDRATFRCPDPDAAELCAKDVNDWVQDQLKAAALALLPSPAGWSAPETLAQVVARLLAPAAQLAQTLRSGRPAPRMLPTATWLPAAPRVRQAAA